MVKEAIWLFAASGVALGIVLDMRRLKVNCVGLPWMGWALACVCAGPAAGAAYLVVRPAVQRALIKAVWQAVGDATAPLEVRRARLFALHHSGLIGKPVFRTCLRTLEQDSRFTKA